MREDLATKREGNVFGFELFGCPIMALDTMFLGKGKITAHPDITGAIKRISEKSHTAEDIKNLNKVKIFPMPDHIQYNHPYVPISHPYQIVKFPFNRVISDLTSSS